MAEKSTKVQLEEELARKQRELDIVNAELLGKGQKEDPDKEAGGDKEGTRTPEERLSPAEREIQKLQEDIQQLQDIRDRLVQELNAKHELLKHHTDEEIPPEVMNILKQHHESGQVKLEQMQVAELMEKLLAEEKKLEDEIKALKVELKRLEDKLPEAYRKALKEKADAGTTPDITALAKAWHADEPTLKKIMAEIEKGKGVGEKKEGKSEGGKAEALEQVLAALEDKIDELRGLKQPGAAKGYEKTARSIRQQKEVIDKQGNVDNPAYEDYIIQVNRQLKSISDLVDRLKQSKQGQEKFGAFQDDFNALAQEKAALEEKLKGMEAEKGASGSAGSAEQMKETGGGYIEERLRAVDVQMEEWRKKLHTETDAAKKNDILEILDQLEREKTKLLIAKAGERGGTVILNENRNVNRDLFHVEGSARVATVEGGGGGGLGGGPAAEAAKVKAKEAEPDKSTEAEEKKKADEEKAKKEREAAEKAEMEKLKKEIETKRGDLDKLINEIKKVNQVGEKLSVETPIWDPDVKFIADALKDDATKETREAALKKIGELMVEGGKIKEEGEKKIKEKIDGFITTVIKEAKEFVEGTRPDAPSVQVPENEAFVGGLKDLLGNNELRDTLVCASGRTEPELRTAIKWFEKAKAKFVSDAETEGKIKDMLHYYGNVEKVRLQVLKEKCGGRVPANKAEFDEVEAEVEKRIRSIKYAEIKEVLGDSFLNEKMKAVIEKHIAEGKANQLGEIKWNKKEKKYEVDRDKINLVVKEMAAQLGMQDKDEDLMRVLQACMLADEDLRLQALQTVQQQEAEKEKGGWVKKAAKTLGKALGYAALGTAATMGTAAIVASGAWLIPVLVGAAVGTGSSMGVRFMERWGKDKRVEGELKELREAAKNHNGPVALDLMKKMGAKLAEGKQAQIDGDAGTVIQAQEVRNAREAALAEAQKGKQVSPEKLKALQEEWKKEDEARLKELSAYYEQYCKAA